MDREFGYRLWQENRRYRALVKYFIEHDDTIKLAKVRGFPKAGVLYPRKKCKYRWNRGLCAQAAIHGLKRCPGPSDKIFYVTDATDPETRPWLIIKYRKDAQEHSGADHFYWYIVTDGEIFWFGNHVRATSGMGVNNLTIELDTPDIHPDMMDISAEDVVAVMHDYESHMNFISFER